MEVARLFGVLPIEILRLPISEYRVMRRYYVKYRESLEDDGGGEEPTDGTIVE